MLPVFSEHPHIELAVKHLVRRSAVRKLPQRGPRRHEEALCGLRKKILQNKQTIRKDVMDIVDASQSILIHAFSIFIISIFFLLILYNYFFIHIIYPYVIMN